MDQAFRLDRKALSARENQVVDLAIVGMTDNEIANELGISTSTVISYWVRIRGKVGHLTRTEIVASSLRAEAHTRIEAYRDQVRKLEDTVAERTRHGGQSQDPGGFGAILDNLPDAVFTCDASGTIEYVNLRVLALLKATPEDLVGHNVSTIFPAGSSPAIVPDEEMLFDRSHRSTIGLTEVVFARKKSGEQFRAVLAVSHYVVGDRPMAACVIRSFVDEIDLRRRHAIAVVEGQ
jgi:PAS domain S-box-containing protein